MSESTMVCETVWDEPPSFVVFKGRHGWPVYVPDRECIAVGSNGKSFEPDAKSYLIGAYCSECSWYLGGQDESHIGEYCRHCGAKVVE